MCHDIKHGMISRLKRPIAFLRKIKIQKRMMLFFSFGFDFASMYSGGLFIF